MRRASHRTRRIRAGLPVRDAEPFLGTGDYLDDGWLAGFIDGEGYFGMASSHEGWAPTFALVLREDDGDVLRGLQAAFGGNLHRRPARHGSQPCLHWQVASKPVLARVVAYLDEHPLRAKKRHEFAVWRRAVECYTTGGAHHPELPALAERLRQLRGFEAA